MLSLLVGPANADYSIIVLLFVLAPIILLCWLVVALIRWLNRH